MRQRLTVLALAGVSAFAVGCTTVVGGTALPADNSGPPPQNPVAVSALDGLLIDARQINDALSATSMKVWFSAAAMWDWSSTVSDRDCLPLDGPAQDKVYAGTGWTAVRGQRLDDSVDDSKGRNHYAIQAVIAYPSARDANAFFGSSVQSWSACANRRFSDLPQGQAPGRVDGGRHQQGRRHAQHVRGLGGRRRMVLPPGSDGAQQRRDRRPGVRLPLGRWVGGRHRRTGRGQGGPAIGGAAVFARAIS